MDIKSIQPGLWSSPATWEGGRLPLPADKAIINHIVIIDTAALVWGVVVNSVLSFKIDKTIDLTSTGNVVVNGTLQMIPNPDVNHRILSTGINENNFVGGGETVLDSDIGIWVMGAGQLDLQGTLTDGWKTALDVTKEYDEVIRQAITLPRNVRIEGTSTGQSHLFIKSTKPQTIKYVQFRYMGPRKDTSGDGIKEFVTGRYAVHFHHCENGSRGSIVEGCIARDCTSHVFVPHGSHGITMRGNIVNNVLDEPFWWDSGHRTNDLVWENNLVAKVGFIPRASSEGAPQGGAGGMVLGFGDGNICRGNVVIGTSGDYRAAGAYIWREERDDNDISKDLTSSWVFENNTAINCPSGDQVWQNSEHHHVIRGSNYINCTVPVYHGAYANHYARIDCLYKGGTTEVWAASDNTIRVLFINCTFDAQGADYCVVINEGPGVGAAPIMFRNCKFINFNKKAILNQNPGPGIKKVDVIDCGLTPDKYQVSSVAISGEVIRIQEGDKAWKITKSGTSVIAKFAPSLWGTGTGLKAEYFSTDFKTKYLERIEPNVNLFDLTHPSPHYLVPTTFAARWTGKIQAQVTGSHTFTVFAGGGMKLWVNGQMLLDSWNEKYPAEFSSKIISLVAGQLYDTKLEYVNTDDRSGCMLYWACGIIKKEFVPMSQLYPGEVKPPDPPVNQKPTADAGADQLIGIAFYLTGKGVDIDGTITGYKWEQVSGPLSVIVSPTDRNTLVNPSGKGDYIFRLTVTDDKGATGVDEVKVTVG